MNYRQILFGLFGGMFLLAASCSIKQPEKSIYRPIVIASDEIKVVDDSGTYIINIPASDTTFTIKNIASRGMRISSVCLKKADSEDYVVAGFGAEKYLHHFKGWYDFSEYKNEDGKIQCHIFKNKKDKARSLILTVTVEDYFAPIYINQSAGK